VTEDMLISIYIAGVLIGTVGVIRFAAAVMRLDASRRPEVEAVAQNPMGMALACAFVAVASLAVAMIWPIGVLAPDFRKLMAMSYLARANVDCFAREAFRKIDEEG